jgi:hypothetical protein
LGEDGPDERVVVDLPVPASQSAALPRPEHTILFHHREARPDSLDGETLKQLVDLLVAHLLAELGEDISEFASADEAVTGLVEHLEALDEFV